MRMRPTNLADLIYLLRHRKMWRRFTAAQLSDELGADDECRFDGVLDGVGVADG